jgi:hypothetical protein
MNEKFEKKSNASTQESTDAPRTRLTIEVPTEVQAGMAKVCTCPPGCCATNGPNCW